MNFLDRIENKLSSFFSAVFRRGKTPEGENAPDGGSVIESGIAPDGREVTAEPEMEATKSYCKSKLDQVKEESTTRVFCRISDPEATAVREALLLSEIPLVRLEVIHGMDQEATFEFGVSQGVIGRSKGSMIELSDPNVSRMHARLEINKTQTVIYDNNSTNGTKVNGRRITKQVLHNGDVIAIGQTELRFAVISPTKPKAGRDSSSGFGRGFKSRKQKGRR